MTVTLSVSDVRAALQGAAGPRDSGVGEPATLLLGTIFHQTFADLVDPNPEKSGLRIIAEGKDDESRRLEQLLSRAWSRLFAPRIVRHAASLRDASAQVLMCWRATQNLCRWLDAIVSELLVRQPELHGTWEKLHELLSAEVPISCEFEQPDWTEPVRLVGIADSILRVPKTSAFCALELKLGRATPVVDLGQAVLYHLILTRTGRRAEHSALSLARFSPDLDEQLVQANALEPAQERLLELIGTIAGVVSKQKRPSDIPDLAPVSSRRSAIAEDLSRRLQRAYREQGVGVEMRGMPQIGPRFLRFEVRLAAGMRLDGLRRRTEEVQHRLALLREPLIVQDAGRLFVDIERPDPESVPFHAVLPQLPKLDALRGSANVPLGVDSANHLQFADLASSGRSHILVAGTTGSGKSEWLRMVIAGLIASNTPETVRFVTLDPKLAAFGDLERSSYLWRPNSWWIPNAETTPSEVFLELVEEMDRRYALVHDAGCDNLREFVEKTKQPLFRIVCVCDEYFALIAQQKQEKQAIEHAVALLGAKGRAAGVHLILATQQPSRATISGAIQANLPCRVALYLPNAIESNMILSQSGAERLTGAGDLLYKDFGTPVRLQAPYLTPKERATWLRR
ncbi:MAG TPA: FtsK/SpoIIIE domain-containing protein [Polyangiaceae bacterium]|nr:FtsK/SpoIIIE domain-containing protein [Polyangiaceae bacterium]